VSVKGRTRTPPRRNGAGGDGSSDLAGKSPRERIVLATIFCIEEFGVSGATVRRIVKSARVNVAAINYYFGSKDRLLEAALAQTLHEAFPKALGELRDFIARHGGRVEAGTRAFFRDYLKHAFRYPGIGVAHLRDALLRQDYSGPAVAEMRRFIEGFYSIVSPAMPGSESEKRLAVVQVWAALFNHAILPELFGLSQNVLTGEKMVGWLVRSLFTR
jgi:TetR/AcrR family transcriptional regulator, regulator of cefoperazone and chloramphenicol sensitivity